MCTQRNNIVGGKMDYNLDMLISIGVCRGEKCHAEWSITEVLAFLGCYTMAAAK